MTVNSSRQPPVYLDNGHFSVLAACQLTVTTPASGPPPHPQNLLLSPHIYRLYVSCSVVSDSLLPPWTVARHTPLSMGSSRQRSWGGLPFSSPRHLPNPGTEPGLLHCRQTLHRLSYGPSCLQAGLSRIVTPSRESLRVCGKHGGGKAV